MFKVKYNTDNSVIVRNARLVARGYSRFKDIDYKETFSPVVRMTTISIILNISNQLNYIIHKMDVSIAFLNVKLNEEIYIVPPPGFVFQLITPGYLKLLTSTPNFS